MAGSTDDDLQTAIDNLDAKIVSGVSSAAHKGKSVTLQSLESLRALRAELARRQARHRRSPVAIGSYTDE